MNIYQQQILDNYHNPRNFGAPDRYDHSYKLENLSCGDEITIYLQVENNTIAQAYFDGEGCAISIASASLLTEYLEEKTLDELRKLQEQDILEILGIQLTTSRMRCATLSLEAAQKAVSPENK